MINLVLIWLIFLWFIVYLQNKKIKELEDDINSIQDELDYLDENYIKNFDEKIKNIFKNM